MTKQIIRFNLQITETSSFRLELCVSQLLTHNVETLAKEHMLNVQSLGWHKDIDFEKFCFFNKITFMWQGWID